MLCACVDTLQHKAAPAQHRATWDSAARRIPCAPRATQPHMGTTETTPTPTSNMY